MNPLRHEHSLYLRQHADNPVDWLPWGEKAFEKAQNEDKPLLISIGYSSCHWCHVMAHESFEDASIAKLMNTHFVCVKVDREERPDVDRVYMDAVQMMNGHGGWPLNVFCLPDGRPFAGGTYFPPDDRRGHTIVPWPQLLMRVADFYQRQKSDLIENAKAILGNLAAGNQPVETHQSQFNPNDLIRAASDILDRADPEFGGFGEAPKFPPANTLDFLLTLRSSAKVDLKERDLAKAIDQSINRTLTGMAHGGIYDQIAGGFARYSVDRHWLIPHFEKMLYDNALLIHTYSRASQRYPKPLYARVVEETIHWLQEEMQLTHALFAAAIDADAEGEEGKFTLWTPGEVCKVLGNQAGHRFCEAYGITEEGNFEHSGKSNPVLLIQDIAGRDAFSAERQHLLAHRKATRVAPQRDDKALLSWNALLVRGLTAAAFAFDRSHWFELSINTAEAIFKNLRSVDGRLISILYPASDVSPKPVPTGEAHLDDYAHLAEACLAIAALAPAFHTSAEIWLHRAQSLASEILQRFSDPSGPGFFFTPNDKPNPIHQKKEWLDTSTPAGNSSLLHVFSQLAFLYPDSEYRLHYAQLLEAYSGLAQRAPAAVCHALTAATTEAIGIASFTTAHLPSLAPLRRKISQRPHRAVFFAANPNLSQSPSFQLCLGHHCLPPESSPDPLLEAFSPLPSLPFPLNADES